jgi:hypothetical protein
MIQFDTTKSLQELENEDWGEASFDSHLVKECHRLHRLPLKDFSIEDLRIMIGQNVSLNYLLPLAIQRLEQNPLAEGNLYSGDLLVNVLRVDPNFWLKFPALKAKVTEIADEAFEIPSITKIEFESIRDAYNFFLRAFASLR